MLTSAIQQYVGQLNSANFCIAAFIKVSAMEERASTYSGGQHLSENNNLTLTAVQGSQVVARRRGRCHMCNNYIHAGDQIIGCLIDGEERVWQCSDNCGKPLYFIDEGFSKEPEWVPCIHISLYW